MDDLADVDFAREKIRAARAQLSQLEAADFPYGEPKHALGLLTALYERDLARLERIDAGTHKEVRQQACAQVNLDLSKYLTIFGFLLRATNVRNAFEVYDPLSRMCRTLCGPDAKLILSSEWMYSPFTYPAWFKDLPRIIFIGLPATEAGNALIVPAAGHELGHSVWRMDSVIHIAPIRSAIEKKLESEVIASFSKYWEEFQNEFPDLNHSPADLTTHVLLRQIWSRSYRLALRQVEELFCDALGLRLFGESFLYSFLYLIAPHLAEPTPDYPRPSVRVENLRRGCNRFGVTLPSNYESFFADPQRSISGPSGFLFKMADLAANTLLDDILDAAEKYTSAVGVELPDGSERDRIVAQFRSLSPASGARTLADIMNAGWVIRLDWEKWEEYRFDEPTAAAVLNDLLYKTIEVMEYDTRIGAAGAS